MVSNIKALVVDDIKANRETIEFALDLSSISSVTADSLENARAAIERQAFDLAIVDLALKGPDTSDRGGWKVGDLLKQSGDETAATLITGYGGGNGKIANESHVEHGFENYFDRDEIEYEEIKRWIDKRGLYKPTRIDLKSRYLIQVAEFTCPPRTRGRRDYSYLEWRVDLDSVLQASPAGGIDTVLGFAFRGFMPIVHMKSGDGVYMEVSNGLLVINCWSRGAGKPMMFVVANRQSLARVLDEIEVKKSIIGVPVKNVARPNSIVDKWNYLWAETSYDRLFFDSVLPEVVL